MNHAHALAQQEQALRGFVLQQLMLESAVRAFIAAKTKELVQEGSGVNNAQYGLEKAITPPPLQAPPGLEPQCFPPGLGCHDKVGMEGVVGGVSENNAKLTSLVVRNIPASCTQESLMVEWPNNDGSYDLLYKPRSTKQQGQTCAFINFTSHAAAQAFKNRWHGQRLNHGTEESGKRLNVSFARVQGRDAMLSLYKKRRVGRMKGPYQPIVFQSGVRMDLDNALAAVSKQSTTDAAGGPFEVGVVYSF